ncbi:MAG: flagellar motor switch phosphatase FliY [Clostridiaceae bacterium]|nr:flagellar motor switch phosphatase FliY [Clostridiaceae bacterium]
MGDMLSQAEIDALLNGAPADVPEGSDLDPQEIDALGEIGNISMGTSATTLFTLLGQKVTITTPTVSVGTWNDMASEYSDSFVGVRVEYTNGLIGTNLLIMKEVDVKVITDLMMGGDGSNIDGSLSELHLSAISEAMNQMVGSSSTSMSSMFDKRIDISPPKAFIFDTDNFRQNMGIDESEKVVKVSFKMVIGDLVDSEIMQILPLPFAKKMVENLLHMETDSGTYDLPEDSFKAPAPPVEHPGQAVPEPHQPAQQQPAQQMYSQPHHQQMPEPQGYQQDYGYAAPEPRVHREPVNVSPAHFQNFEDSRIVLDKKNINLIMDVPLQVTVELGRTEKLIKDILEFSPGSIIELDKLAGEPVDILVNGKAIAKGEVVVIDESFGVRITDIIHPSKRL